MTWNTTDIPELGGKVAVVRPGSDGAIGVLWQIAEQETGIAIDVQAAVAGT